MPRHSMCVMRTARIRGPAAVGSGRGRSLGPGLAGAVGALVLATGDGQFGMLLGDDRYGLMTYLKAPSSFFWKVA